MVYDKLDNIEIYRGLSDDIYEGLVFLKNTDPEIAKCVYQINPRVKAIVSEYETKIVNEHGYEAHKRFIDIQCVLKGEELVACLPFERLKETKPYSEETDAALYTADTNLHPSTLSLQPGYFAIFYPQDGHMPQLCINAAQMVKKIVVKVEIERNK